MQQGLCEEARILKDVPAIVLDCHPEVRQCAYHGTALHVMKTDTRNALSINYPPFRYRKVFLYCPECKKCAELGAQVPWKYVPETPLLTRGKSPFAMDIVAKVGIMKYIDCMRREDISATLKKEYGCDICDGSLSDISKEFLVRVKCLHQMMIGQLSEEMAQGGGYILGIDGTGDGGGERILIIMDLLRDLVLLSERISSESKDNITPYVQTIKAQFGLPLASVCDMHLAMMNPLLEVMKGVALRVCHYHLFDDIGCDLMKEQYLRFRQLIINRKLRPYLVRLRKRLFQEIQEEGLDIGQIAKEMRYGIIRPGVTIAATMYAQVYDTLSWILRYHEDNHGMRFPFAYPYLSLYERAIDGLKAITRIRQNAARGNYSPKYLRDLETYLRDMLVENKVKGELLDLYASLKSSIKLFDELRSILHIPRDKTDIPRDKLIIRSNEDIGEMRAALMVFRDRLEVLAADGNHPQEQIILDHLDRYWPYIILDNAKVTINGEEVQIEIPRTSGGNETCFGMIKVSVRKRLGKKDIGRELDNYGDHFRYVHNLKNKEYVTMLCGSLDNLTTVFETIPPKMVADGLWSLQKRMIGYDITKGKRKEKPVTIEEISNGVNQVGTRVEEVMEWRKFYPPEMWGREPNGLLTL